MEEGLITGLNPTKARLDIVNFQSQFFSVANKCCRAVDGLIDGLMINWASPKAVEFMKYYENKIIDTFYSNPTTVCEDIITRAESAFNSMSTSQGGPTLGDIPHMGIGAGGFQLLPEIDGNVGMNIEAVKGIIAAFEEEVEDGLNDYDNLPTTIAFYDPAGTVAAVYKTKIKTIK